MTVNQRSDCVQNAKWYPIHLSDTHDYDSCAQKNDLKHVCGVNGCTNHHHQSLHGSSTAFMATINTLQTGLTSSEHMLPNSPVLLSMQTIPTVAGNIIVSLTMGWIAPSSLIQLQSVLVCMERLLVWKLQLSLELSALTVICTQSQFLTGKTALMRLKHLEWIN